MQTLISSPLWGKLSLYVILARLHRPIGIWLILFPALWGLFLSSPNPFPLKEAFLLFLGSTLIRSAGCIYNDLVDRNIDKKVYRTKERPLAARLLSFQEGIFCFFVFLSAAFGVLLIFPLTTIYIGISAVPLILIYPWLKRLTYWPQLFLGFAMNWGLLMGWTAREASLKPSLFLLMVAGVCWTLGYDTLYAHQDKEDDQLIGVKSTAIRLKGSTKPFLFLVYSVFLISFIEFGRLESMSWPFYGGLGVAGFFFYQQIMNTHLEDSFSCLKAFKLNTWVGLSILIGILVAQ